MAGRVLSKCLAALAFLGSFSFLPQDIAADPWREKGPAQILLANGLGSACEGELQLVSRALCFGRLSKARNNLSICDQAEHPGVKHQCYHIFAQHAEDLTVCRKIADRNLEDGCYSDLAALKDDPDICQRIAGPGVKDGCYYKIARARPNPALCGKIEDRGLRSGCTREASSAE